MIFMIIILSFFSGVSCNFLEKIQKRQVPSSSSAVCFYSGSVALWTNCVNFCPSLATFMAAWRPILWELGYFSTVPKYVLWRRPLGRFQCCGSPRIKTSAGSALFANLATCRKRRICLIMQLIGTWLVRLKMYSFFCAPTSEYHRLIGRIADQNAWTK